MAYTGRHLKPIIKPTNECNLSCKYCYTNYNADSGRMNSSTLINTIVKIASYNGLDSETAFIWHGGEPLLMGIDFFKLISEISIELSKRGYKISHCIQTNGTLINESYLDFFEENNFRLGLSLDGPPSLHNMTRIFCDGTGSFNAVFKAIELIKKRKSKLGLGAILILTRLNINHIKTIYKFFNKHEISIKVNPIKRGHSLLEYDQLSISPEDYGIALKELFNIWYYDHRSKIQVDPLNLLMKNILSNEISGCQFISSCQNNFMSISPQGNLYPCGGFDGNREYLLGNINYDDIQQIENSPLRQKLKSRGPSTIPHCKNCDFKRICNSGCMHNAYQIKGNLFDFDYYCISYKIIISHILKALQLDLANAAKEISNAKTENCSSTWPEN